MCPAELEISFPSLSGSGSVLVETARDKNVEGLFHLDSKVWLRCAKIGSTGTLPPIWAT